MDYASLVYGVKMAFFFLALPLWGLDRFQMYWHEKKPLELTYHFFFPNSDYDIKTTAKSISLNSLFLQDMIT